MKNIILRTENTYDDYKTYTVIKLRGKGYEITQFNHGNEVRSRIEKCARRTAEIACTDESKVLELRIKPTKKTEAKIAEIMRKETELSNLITAEQDRISYNESSESYGINHSDIRKYYATSKLRALDKKHATALRDIDDQFELYTNEEWDSMKFTDSEGLDWIHCFLSFDMM